MAKGLLMTFSYVTRLLYGPAGNAGNPHGDYAWRPTGRVQLSTGAEMYDFYSRVLKSFVN